jgi:DNA-binding LacI/PurR family transcriptional regulator
MPVPQDLSVVGFDDVPLAAQVWPPLTTVRQPIYDIAKLATELLIDILSDKPPQQSCFALPTALVIRESTCALQN